MAGCRSLIVAIGAVLSLIGPAAAHAKATQTYSDAELDAARNPRRPIFVTVEKLSLDFRTNQVTANDRYRDRLVTIRGIVDRIDDADPELRRPPTIWLKHFYQGDDVRALVDRKTAASVRTGWGVTLECDGVHADMISVVAKGCNLVENAR